MGVNKNCENRFGFLTSTHFFFKKSKRYGDIKMPKNKSKKKGSGRGDKEKPLLTVQGILRLDKTFVTAQYADAEVIKVKLKEEEEAKEVKLIPGSSEHDNVKYK